MSSFLNKWQGGTFLSRSDTSIGLLKDNGWKPQTNQDIDQWAVIQYHRTVSKISTTTDLTLKYQEGLQNSIRSWNQNYGCHLRNNRKALINDCFCGRSILPCQDILLWIRGTVWNRLHRELAKWTENQEGVLLEDMRELCTWRWPSGGRFLRGKSSCYSSMENETVYVDV